MTITSVPNSCDYVGEFNEDLKIYFCVDEFSLWPGLDYEMVSKMEKKLLSRVDLVIATSDLLAKTKVVHKRETPVIGHGVEFDHFDIGKKEMGTPFRLCYFGLFDERTDQKILIDIVEAIPDLELHILGPVVCDNQILSKHKRIHFWGRIPYEKLPKEISKMDAFILPYVRSELTENINPLKLKEYLATTRPVFSTALPEVVKMRDYLYLFDTSNAVVDLIAAIRSKTIRHDGERIRKYILENETWKAKSDRLFLLIQSALNAISKL